jgi:CheY-like chemotaxis protein
MRILIAEDNVAMAQVLRFNLERAGYTVCVASDGRQALESAQEQHFDLVITDYQMPGMTGEELCRGLRELPEYRSTPVMMCTAKEFELDATYLSESLGVNNLIQKPFSPRQVVEQATALLSNRLAVPV